jgi:hypothetical protein
MKIPPSLFDIVGVLGVLIVVRRFCGAIVPGGGESRRLSSSSGVCPSSDIEPESF